MEMMNQALNNAKQCEAIIYCINIYIIYIILKKNFCFSRFSHWNVCFWGIPALKRCPWKMTPHAVTVRVG